LQDTDWEKLSRVTIEQQIDGRKSGEEDKSRREGKEVDHIQR